MQETSVSLPGVLGARERNEASVRKNRERNWLARTICWAEGRRVVMVRNTLAVRVSRVISRLSDSSYQVSLVISVIIRHVWTWSCQGYAWPSNPELDVDCIPWLTGRLKAVGTRQLAPSPTYSKSGKSDTLQGQ
jgi:hypothetical protein